MQGQWIPAAILAAAATPLSAQTAPPVEQAEALPDLAVPADKLGDDRKYIVFHKPGVTVEQARADLSFCWRFLPHGVARQAPGFVPWRKADANRPVRYDGGAYGLVGLAIGAIIAGPLERSIRQSRLYRCMVPRGYARYRTSEDVWKLLNTGSAAPRAIMLQARIAAGPTPPTPKVEP
ncbi:MAG: hypothetical protein JWL96_2856 [Sphingomonas bacterium]|uniref:hypothetical protein n=1 Tax=Sphingomonas bacterium TaxID=1895847 RepID=UPI00262669DE|nr:hypothetical protein [Sphingomonas bacterium]MDB5710786.1 hypothetical protein [Sphingomonas bacterium]